MPRGPSSAGGAQPRRRKAEPIIIQDGEYQTYILPDYQHQAEPDPVGRIEAALEELDSEDTESHLMGTSRCISAILDVLQNGDPYDAIRARKLVMSKLEEVKGREEIDHRLRIALFTLHDLAADVAHRTGVDG